MRARDFIRPAAVALLLSAVVSNSLPAAAPVVFRGARILTAAGGDGDKVFDPGVLVIQDGKIVAVGPADKVKIPEGATVHDAAGAQVRAPRERLARPARGWRSDQDGGVT